MARITLSFQIDHLTPKPKITVHKIACRILLNTSTNLSAKTNAKLDLNDAHTAVYPQFNAAEETQIKDFALREYQKSLILILRAMSRVLPFEEEAHRILLSTLQNIVMQQEKSHSKSTGLKEWYLF